MKISAATTDPGHLLYDPAELDAARCLAVLIPGAFTHISIFEQAEVWRARGYGLAHYRFPGLDGRAVSPPLNLEVAAAEIIALAQRYPDKPLRLLGYSTGGPIALIAAMQLEHDVKVALMSTAVPRAGGAATRRRTLKDLAQAAWDAGSPRLSVFWFYYFRVLLFGRAVRQREDLFTRAEAVIAARRKGIVIPSTRLAHAHTFALRRWRCPPSMRFSPGQVQVFWGASDPVFHRDQIEDFARQIGGAPITVYPEQGHLLFASHDGVFEDVFRFFET